MRDWLKLLNDEVAVIRPAEKTPPKSLFIEESSESDDQEPQGAMKSPPAPSRIEMDNFDSILSVVPKGGVYSGKGHFTPAPKMKPSKSRKGRGLGDLKSMDETTKAGIYAAPGKSYPNVKSREYSSQEHGAYKSRSHSHTEAGDYAAPGMYPQTSRTYPHTEAGYYAAPGMYPPSFRMNPHTEAGEYAAPHHGMYPKHSQQPRLLEQRWRNTDTVAGKNAEPGMYQQYQTRGEMQGKTGWAPYEQKQFQQESEDDYDSDENYHTYGNMRSAVHDMRKYSHNQREIYNPNMRRAVRSTSHSSQGETSLRDDFTSPSKSNRSSHRSPPQNVKRGQRPDLQLNLLQHVTGDILLRQEQQISLGLGNATGQKRSIINIGLQATVVKILIVVLMTVKQVMILTPLMIPPQREGTDTLPQKILLEKGIRGNTIEGIKEALCLPK